MSPNDDRICSCQRVASLAWWCTLAWPASLYEWIRLLQSFRRAGRIDSLTATWLPPAVAMGCLLIFLATSTILDTQFRGDREGRTGYLLATIGVVLAVSLPAFPLTLLIAAIRIAP